MGKGPFEDEDEEESETETETDDDERVEEEFGERRGRKIMIRVVSGKRSGGGGIEPETDGGGSLCCQADECSASLSLAKMYYRRHKVCERHAKAAVVLVAGIRQRFCQQCSRFHEISQFDNNKRSCRSRLAGHNERRRKAPPNIKQVEDGEEPSTMSETRNPNCSGQLSNPCKKHSRA